jgi:hypothetical protein
MPATQSVEIAHASSASAGTLHTVARCRATCRTLAGFELVSSKRRYMELRRMPVTINTQHNGHYDKSENSSTLVVAR